MTRKLFFSSIFLLPAFSFFAQTPTRRNSDLILPAMERLRTISTYTFSNFHICIDQPQQTNLPPKTEVPKIPGVTRDGKLIQPTTRLRQSLASVTDRMWTAGETITVGFYKNETTEKYINKVKQYAKEWEFYSNIFFSFIDNVTNAQVRVGFANGTSWSYIGRDVLVIPANYRTMNLGWLNDSTTEVEIRHVILHEFGHTLGFIHEHSSPTSAIPWNKDKVYELFGKAPANWDSATVDRNIFQKYSSGETNFSSYDKHSIMHYFFPAELTSNQTVFYQNNIPSAVDIRFAGIFYPFPVNPSGTLFTGDDCDEIDFVIEYNVVAKHLVEFSLQPGIDKSGKLVSWWKQVGIPLQGGVTMPLELAADGKTNAVTTQINILDKSRPLSFAKAKLLGVHTALEYKWDILPAVIGGCRLKLIWRNDHCY